MRSVEFCVYSGIFRNIFVVHACYLSFSDLKVMAVVLKIAGMYPVCNNNALCLVYVGANKFYRDQVTSRDQEPWLFRGGLLGEIQVCIGINKCCNTFRASRCHDHFGSMFLTIEVSLDFIHRIGFP